MKLYRLQYILLAALLFAACSDKHDAEPSALTDVERITISYTTDGYGRGLSRADAATEEYCWQDMNETAVETIDLFFLDNEGKVTLYQPFDAPSEFHGRHEIISFASDQTGDITFDIVKAASKIAMVANYHINMGNPHGKTFAEIFKDGLSGLQHNRPQDLFVMYGEVIVPANLSRYANIEVPLSRVAAKIRVSLHDASNATVSHGNFYSMLCRYATTSPLLPESQALQFTGVDVNTTLLPSTTSVALSNTLIADGTTIDDTKPQWTYPSDITTRGIQRTGDEGHIYYTYPSDWIDYSVVKNQCTRLDNDGHKDAEHKEGKRYEVLDYDDKAPIKQSREMFLIVKAQYESSWYYYKVPVNFRFATINDHQCFDMSELTEQIFPLYRADRNTFYDIIALIDRAGGDRPETAVNATIGILGDGGIIRYILDGVEVDFTPQP